MKDINETAITMMTHERNREKLFFDMVILERSPKLRFKVRNV